MGDVLMLGVSGMRGIVGSTVTPEVVARFAGTLGAWLVQRAQAASSKKKTPRPLVCLARDGRDGGQMLMHAAAAGLLGAGCDVVDLGIAMTPTAGVAVDALSAHAGVVITASHNPQQWNGLKVLLRDRGAPKGTASACAPAKTLANEIIEQYTTAQPRLASWDSIGALCPTDGLIQHRKAAIAAVKATGAMNAVRKARFTIALDSVGGAGTDAGHDFLSALGCKVRRLYDTIGRFPHTPEPTRENLTGLCKAVRSTKAAAGFAQDPDADRLAIVDEKGSYIGEEYTLVLAARALFELTGVKKGSYVAVNLSTSRMIDDLCAQHGVRVIRTAVGEANVVEAMKREKCVIGGEGNGGVILPSVTYIRDSLSAMGLVLALLASTKKPLSALVAEMPAYCIVKRKVDLARKEDAHPAVAKIATTYSHQRVDLQDGVRVDFDSLSAWVHVRASNTEPIMRLIAEAPTPATANALLDEITNVIG